MRPLVLTLSDPEKLIFKSQRQQWAKATITLFAEASYGSRDIVEYAFSKSFLSGTNGSQ